MLYNSRAQILLDKQNAASLRLAYVLMKRAINILSRHVDIMEPEVQIKHKKMFETYAKILYIKDRQLLMRKLGNRME